MIRHSILLAGIASVLPFAGCTSTRPPGAPGTAAIGPDAPSVVYVADFHLDASQITHRGLLGGERGGRLHSRIALGSVNDPASKAGELIATLSNTIVAELRQQGINAARLPDAYAEILEDGRILCVSMNLPREGWLLTGSVLDMEEGNAAVAASIGLGIDAGKASAEVAVSDLAADPSLPILCMGARNHTRRMPGGLASRNPYVIAAKFVINRRHGMERDVRSLGKQIAKILSDHIRSSSGPAQ